MSGPPSIQKTECELRTLAIGQWDEKSKYEGMLSPVALIEKMATQKLFPIGRIVSSTTITKDSGQPMTVSRNYLGCWVSLQSALLYLQTLADKFNLLKFPEDPEERVIEFGLRVDGAKTLSHPLIAILAFFIWKPEYTKATPNCELRTDVLRFYPIGLLILPEMITTIHQVLKYARENIKDLVPVSWKGYTYLFKFAVITGDHSALQKALGNNVGGHKKCELCD
jgi:hypothetical protein